MAYNSEHRNIDKTDLDRMEIWAATSEVKFNKNKCKIYLWLGRKKN